MGPAGSPSGFDPEALEVAGEDGAGIPAVVNLVEELGSEAYVYCQLAENANDAITAVPDVIMRVDPHRSPSSGDKIELRVQEGSMLLLTPNPERGSREHEPGRSGRRRVPDQEPWPTTMEFVGLRTRLKPGMEDAYEKAHAVVWPELVTAQRTLGISRWLIFRDGLELFHTVECENFERAVAGLAQHPVDRRWQAHMGRYVVIADDQSGGGATDCLAWCYAG